MIDCSKCIHYEVCSNRFANDGCEGACGFYLQDIRPHGEWILLRTNYEDSGNNFYECTNCHYRDIHADSAEVPYCWHCGADMRPEKKLQTPSCLTNPERQAELLERYKEE